MSANETYDLDTPDKVAMRGERLSQMLSDERWTARQVAMKIGVSHKYIQERLNGRVDLKFEDVISIAPLLRMTPQQLFDELYKAPPVGLEPTTFRLTAQNLVNSHAGNVTHVTFTPQINRGNSEHTALVTKIYG